MADVPRVSVITRTYNRARYLRGAIDSVLAQGFPSLEAIVVDDGSTDETPAVAASFGDRIRYLRQENRGRAGAWNTGVAAARGEFVAWLDSDDLWLPGRLARQVPMLEARPAAGLLYSAVGYIDEDGKPADIRPSNRPTPSGRILPELLRHNLMQTNAVLARRALVVEAGPLDPTLTIGEDWLVWLRVAARSEVLYDPTPSALTRRHADQSLSDRAEVGDSVIRVLEIALAGFAPEHLPAVRRALATNLLRRARRKFRAGDREEGACCLRRAVEVRPGARLRALLLRMEAALRG
jgi:glycosyltransferase involved in cell wall biosynthesis